MRVDNIVSTLEMASSGVTQAVLGICAGVAKNGVDVRLHSLHGVYGKVKEPKAVECEGCRSSIYPCSSIPFKGLGRSPEMYSALREAAKSADVLHTHNLWMMPNLYPYLAIKSTKSSTCSGCKLVTSPHGTLTPFALKVSWWKKKLMWAYGQGAAMYGTDMFHATCPEEYDNIRRLGFRQPVVRTSLGVSIPNIAAKPKPVEGQRILIYLSRIHTDKRLDLLLDAWEQLGGKFKDWDLHIYGGLEGDYPQKMIDYAKRLGLERVEFKGAVYGDQKWDAYRNADLFILPTHTENFGLVVAEALASGTPAITTNGAPWQGLVTHGCGWWVKESVDGVSGALVEAMSKSREELSEMGSRGRAWMEREFSWAGIGYMLTSAYEWLCHGGTKPDCVIEE